VERRCAVKASTTSAMIFSSGTITLAKKISAASGQEPVIQR